MNTFILIHKHKNFMQRQTINLRKIHGDGGLSLGEFFSEFNIDYGSYVIVETNPTGVLNITPARVEKRPLCKN